VIDNNCQHYSWDDFSEDAILLIEKIKNSNQKFDGVFGPPRGGLTLAVMISHHLKVPFLSKPLSANTLIVDDIADSGKTLEEFKGKNFIATLFYHKQSSTIPDIWIKEKKEKWITFPWEKSK